MFISLYASADVSLTTELASGVVDNVPLPGDEIVAEDGKEYRVIRCKYFLGNPTAVALMVRAVSPEAAGA